MTWWRSSQDSPDVAAIVAQIALDRVRVILPIAMACVVVANTISGPAGIPMPHDRRSRRARDRRPGAIDRILGRAPVA